ncbi:MAG: FAD-dependent oxidoreductase [Deltaproteobacteria bacterium]|nr:FAD-dependent oxidoreductase [Deltaproteobacteria bacterium]
MKSLFSPYRIKGVELKNRIVMPGLASFLLNDDGSVNEGTIEHYRRRAAGGPAMVIMEACAVSPEGIVSIHQPKICDDRFTAGLSKIAEALKSEGAVPAVQIHHGGRQTSIKVIKQKPFAPSPLPCPTINGDVEPLTVQGIQELVKKFGDAADRAVKAGFELIEIHGAHGYIINQFLSGFSNIRKDEYGGDLLRRTRFAEEIVREVRNRVGNDFPLSFKISATEYVPNGLTIEESIQIIKILIEAGIDIVQVSAGNDATPEWICQPMFMKKACLLESAERIKTSLKIPVMTVGRINDPLIADEIIREGKADLVCIGRGLLADPEMPEKARENRLDDIRTCIACNTCMQSIFRRGRVECLVNPSLGREREMAISPARMPKKVMVIGGGPAGLNVAWVAAMRGHEVHLFEKQNALGGQLIMGSITTYKKELQSLIKFQKRQIEKHKVKCYLNNEVSTDTLKDINPDIVILATGAVPFFPDIKGIDKDIVIPFSVILNGENPSSRNTVLIGGGPTGCEVAVHLSENGCPVTIIEMLPDIGEGLETMTKKMLVRNLIKNNVKIITGFKATRIEDNGVFVTDKDSTETFLDAERVVVAAGFRPDNSLYEKIKDLGYEVHQIGDCLEPRSAKTAIYEGAVLGRFI